MGNQDEIVAAKRPKPALSLSQKVVKPISVSCPAVLNSSSLQPQKAPASTAVQRDTTSTTVQQNPTSTPAQQNAQTTGFEQKLPVFWQYQGHQRYYNPAIWHTATVMYSRQPQLPVHRAQHPVPSYPKQQRGLQPRAKGFRKATSHVEGKVFVVTLDI